MIALTHTVTGGELADAIVDEPEEFWEFLKALRDCRRKGFAEEVCEYIRSPREGELIVRMLLDMASTIERHTR